MSAVQYELSNAIGVITIDNPPVNALSHALRLGLKEAIEAAQHDASKVLVLLCQGSTFIAGADIAEFGKPSLDPILPDVLNTIEQSAKPVIAAIHGRALGGGFEVALASHYRCALSSAIVGLPEVTLGLLPGAGGTQRAPRLAGIEKALDLMMSGTPLPAPEALAQGYLDKIIEGTDLKAGALAYAQDLINQGAKPRRTSEESIVTDQLMDGFFERYRQSLAKRAKNQIAPYHIVDCVEATLSLPFDQGMQKERACFIECRESEQSQGLRHQFFAAREAKKIKGLDASVTPRAINKVGIIGGGLMGGGIAMNFAKAGIPVTILEISPEALEKGLATIRKTYQGSVTKGKMSQEAADACIDLIQGSTSYQDLSDMDLVIEAVFESMDVKKQVFSQLDAVCKAGAILATNTSYLNVNHIAAITQRPHDVIGLHFFSPAHIMKLLEIVQADETADDVVATAMTLASRIKKVPVLSRVCYGFIGNRMLRQYLREVQICLLEGASPEQIDRVMMDWGMAMGPLMVADMAGLDISYKARQELSEAEKGNPKSYRIADRLVEQGRLGQKTGAGYYSYDPDSRARSNDPAVIDMIEEVAAELGVARHPMEDATIWQRLMLSLINEGFKILEEGIAQRPGDIDVVYCNGYGFPAYRGGPMFQADHMGLPKVLEAIKAYQESHGDEYWTPSALLVELVAKNQSLADWAQGGNHHD